MPSRASPADGMETTTLGDADDALVLVPGGAGFVGSHLCDRLVERGRRVLALDDLSTGDAEHVAHLPRHPRFPLGVRDLPTGLPAEARAARRGFNLACPASPAHYQRRPVQTTLTSVLGAWHLLEHAQATGARLLQASTSEVYGDPEVHPQTESYWGHVNPIGERSCYDEGKRCAETLFMDYRRQHGLATKIARIFNTYGPRMHPNDGRVVSNFIVQALQNRPITVYGGGRQTRSFCYVSDLVDAFVRLMASADDFAGPVNLGNPDEFTILELA